VALRLVLALIALLLAAPAAAVADEQIRAVPSNQYSPSEYTMDQGERLTFRNLDFNRHNVWAKQNGTDGKPLFQTPVIGQNEESFVEGSQYLTTGDYGFYCTIHPFMEGTLHVNSAGKPAIRPTPGTTPTDSQAPAVGVRLVSARQSAVRRSREVRVSVSVDEAATVTLTVTTRSGGRRITVARGRVRFPAAGTRRPGLDLTRAGRRALRGRRSVRVEAVARAVDAAGNRATARRSGTLRR
jgi:plastocyanin